MILAITPIQKFVIDFPISCLDRLHTGNNTVGRFFNLSVTSYYIHVHTCVSFHVLVSPLALKQL